MHSASVTSVVPVMRLDFHKRRKVWRKSVREPVHMPADDEAEAWCADVIVKDLGLMEETETGW